MSDIDDMLKGAEDQTPATQAQTQGQGTGPEGTKTEGQQSPEEVEFSKLSGNAQERFKKVLGRAATAEQKLREFETQRQQGTQMVPPAAPTDYQSPEAQAALQQLEKAGVATDRKVDAKLNEKLNAVLWNFEQARLESKYTGVDGEPKYDRAEVEDYIRNNPQLAGYSAEDIFRYKMFPDEFLELEVTKKTSGGSTTAGGTKTLRPTKAAVHEETLTPEYINDRLDVKKYGRESVEKFYDDNHEQIEQVLKGMAPLNQ
jgi:hypothetical protein